MVAPRGHEETFAPPLEALPPTFPQSEGENGKNQPLLAIFLDFCPLSYAFSPRYPLPLQKKKKNSGAATGYD